jgi:hypothetical protein
MVLETISGEKPITKKKKRKKKAITIKELVEWLKPSVCLASMKHEFKP